MSAWKSRWSCDRLVNAPTANSMPRRGPIARRGWRPPSPRLDGRARRITASSACRSGASGVVNPVSIASSPISRRDRADQPARVPRGLQPRAHEEAGRRLAARAGDAEHGQPAGSGRRRPRPPPGRAQRGRRRRRSAGTPGGSSRRPAGSVRTATAPAREGAARRSERRARPSGQPRRTGRHGAPGRCHRRRPTTRTSLPSRVDAQAGGAEELAERNGRAGPGAAGRRGQRHRGTSADGTWAAQPGAGVADLQRHVLGRASRSAGSPRA